MEMYFRISRIRVAFAPYCVLFRPLSRQSPSLMHSSQQRAHAMSLLRNNFAYLRSWPLNCTFCHFITLHMLPCPLRYVLALFLCCCVAHVCLVKEYETQIGIGDCKHGRGEANPLFPIHSGIPQSRVLLLRMFSRTLSPEIGYEVILCIIST
jgi:hypothetical protein